MQKIWQFCFTPYIKILILDNLSEWYINRCLKCFQVRLNATPQAAAIIIDACTVLHNFSLEHGMIVKEDNADLDSEKNFYLL